MLEFQCAVLIGGWQRNPVNEKWRTGVIRGDEECCMCILWLSVDICVMLVNPQMLHHFFDKHLLQFVTPIIFLRIRGLGN